MVSGGWYNMDTIRMWMVLVYSSSPVIHRLGSQIPEGFAMNVLHYAKLGVIEQGMYGN